MQAPAHTERQDTDDKRTQRRTVYEYLRHHRITYREFVGSLIQLGVSVETNKAGSGHVVLRHGERAAAIVSGARKQSEKWQPRDITHLLRRLEIPEEHFLVAVTNAGLRVGEEYEGSLDVVEIDGVTGRD